MHGDLHQHITNSVKLELKRRGWTAHRLWKETGVSKSSLYFMLDNTNKWTIDVILKVSKALDLKVEPLLSGGSSGEDRNLLYENEKLKQEMMILKDELATYKAVLNIDALKKIKI